MKWKGFTLSLQLKQKQKNWSKQTSNNSYHSCWFIPHNEHKWIIFFFQQKPVAEKKENLLSHVLFDLSVTLRGSPCQTWPAPRSTSCWANWASTRRPRPTRRCQKSSASLPPKTARSKTRPPPPPPQRPPPQSPGRRPSTLTSKPSAAGVQRERNRKRTAHFTHTAPRLLHDRLASWPRGSRTAASRSWISVYVRIETEASAEGLLKVWLCTYHSCYLTFIFYSNNNLRVHSVSVKTKKKKKPSGMKCCLFYFVSWFIVCLWFSAAVKCSCVSYCFLPIVKLNEAQG